MITFPLIQIRLHWLFAVLTAMSLFLFHSLVNASPQYDLMPVQITDNVWVVDPLAKPLEQSIPARVVVAFEHPTTPTRRSNSRRGRATA